MKKGGYKIINLKNIDFTKGTEKTVDGIYEEIESSYRKALMISGLVIGGVERNDCFVGSVEVVSTDYVLTCGSLKITVASDDGVTISDLIEEE